MHLHKIATASLATALIAVSAAGGALWSYLHGPALGAFLHPATDAHREAQSLLERNQPRDAEGRCRQAIDSLDRVPARFQDDERYRLERGAVFETLGLIHVAKDRPDLAVEDFRRTIDIWTKLIARDELKIELRKRLARCATRMAPIFIKLGRWKDAETILDRGDAICQTRLTRSAPDRRLDPEWVEILNQHGTLLLHKGESTPALEKFTTAERVQKNSIQQGAATGEDRERLIVTLINKAKAHATSNELADAERVLVEARGLAERLRADLPATQLCDEISATILDSLAELIGAHPERRSEARGVLEKSLSIREKLAADSSSPPETIRRLAETCDSLVELCLDEKSFKQAEALQRRALIYSARLEKEHPIDLELRFEHGRSLHNLAELLRKRGRQDEALPFQRQAVERLDAVYKYDILNPDYRTAISYAYWTLANLELDRGDHRAAAVVIDEYLKIEPRGYEEAYESARFLCRAIPLCREDHGLPLADRERLARSYADRAVSSLEFASHHGFHDLNELRSSHTYDSLRCGPAFEKIVQHVAEVVDALNED
jgi:tetratricopeptide (TPR) repeat protein